MVDENRQEQMNDTSPHPPDAIGSDGRPIQFRACQICRQRKVRCVSLPGIEKCEYCHKHDLECLQIVPQNNKRKRQSTTQADLKARVEQLEERLKLSQRLLDQSGQMMMPSMYSRAPSPQQTVPGSLILHQPPPPQQQQEQRSRQQSVSPPSSYMASAPMSAQKHLLPDGQSFSQQIDSTKFDRLPQTLPPPNISPILRNNLNSFTPSGPPNSFSPILTNYNQQRGSHHFHLSNVNRHNASPTMQQFGDPAHSDAPFRPQRQTATAPDAAELDGESANEAQHSVTRLVGPMAPFDQEFYELCIREGFATQADKECAKAKGQVWARFFRISNDDALPMYSVQFNAPAQFLGHTRTEVSLGAIEQVNKWKQSYGEVLLHTFKRKVLPRYGLASIKTVSNLTVERLDGQSLSLVCATFALAAQAVSTWSLKKRMYLGMEFYLFATRHLERDMSPITMDTLRILVLLSEFPLNVGSSLMNSWALAHAFDLQLNVDPEAWKISEEEKTNRRRLFWWVILSDRYSTIPQHSPCLEQDFYNTKIPEALSTSDQINLRELEITGLMCKISRTFYSVRGAQMAHDNAAASTALCVQFEKQIRAAQLQIDNQFVMFPPNDTTSAVGIAMLHLHLSVCTILIHRPFYENRSIGLIDALEHHRKAYMSAAKFVNIIAAFPDDYFTELWPTLARFLVTIILLTILREATLSPDEGLRVSAKDSLKLLGGVFTRQVDNWYLVNFMKNLLLMAKDLLGNDFDCNLEAPQQMMPSAVETSESPWSVLDAEQFAAFNWDDMSQMFGITAVAPDWLTTIGSSGS